MAIPGIPVTFGQLPQQQQGDTASLNLVGFDPSKPTGQQDRLVPLAMIVNGVAVHHIDLWPVYAMETTYDGALGRLLAAMPPGGGKVLFGPKVYTFTQTINMPNNVTFEGDAGHTGARYPGVPFNQRPYTLLLTPGGGLPAPANPRRLKGSIETGHSCSIKNLNIGSAPVLNAIGPGYGSVLDAQVAFAAMKQVSGGIGITSLGNDPLFENLMILGFNIGILHDMANVGNAGADAPVLRHIRTHCWIGVTIASLNYGGTIYGHRHFPFLGTNSVNCPPNNAWPITIASDGATGTNISIVGGPAINAPSAGMPIAICTQVTAAVPAPATSNLGLNRFGDGVLAPAVWKLVGGIWVINLPTTAPGDFQTSPTSISFIACNDTGIGLWLQGAYMAVTDCYALRAQIGMLIQDTQGVTLIDCSVDHQTAAADMTSVGHSYQGQSWKLTRIGGFINSVTTAFLHNVPRNLALGPHGEGYTRILASSVDIQPTGALLLRRVAGGMIFTSDSFRSPTMITDPSDGEFILFTGGTQFPPLSIGFTINGVAQQSADVVVTAECMNIPAYVLPTGGGSGSLPGNILQTITNASNNASAALAEANTAVQTPAMNAAIAASVAQIQGAQNTAISTALANYQPPVDSITTTLNASGEIATLPLALDSTLAYDASNNLGVNATPLTGLSSFGTLSPTVISSLSFVMLSSSGTGATYNQPMQTLFDGLTAYVIAKLQPSITVGNIANAPVNYPIPVTAAFANYNASPSGVQYAVVATGTTPVNSNYIALPTGASFVPGSNVNSFNLSFTIAAGLAAGTYDLYIRDPNNVTGSFDGFAVSATTAASVTVTGPSGTGSISNTGTHMQPFVFALATTPGGATVYPLLFVGGNPEGTRQTITTSGTSSINVTLTPQTAATYSLQVLPAAHGANPLYVKNGIVIS